MQMFTHKTEKYEKFPVYIAFRKFFNSCFLERDYEKALSLIEEDVFCFGADGEEGLITRDRFIELLQEDIDVIPDSIEYSIESFFGKEISDDIWNVLAEAEVTFIDYDGEKKSFQIRFSGCFRLFAYGFIISMIHISKYEKIQQELLTTLSDEVYEDLEKEDEVFDLEEKNTEKIIFEIISKAVPGGIVIGYAEPDYPLYFVNDRYLELLGYSSYEEYYEDAKGLGMTHIHPDDIDMVNQEIMYSYNKDTQLEIEYRIRHKEGYYIPVYDIGKKMILPNKKEVIICVLYDKTEDAKVKEILIRESNRDPLTGIYNRGGGIRTIEHALKHTRFYSFAFFDIDNLKLLNDVFSHAAGDHAIKYFTQLLVERFDEHTIIARLGGDEFVAFFYDQVDRIRLELEFKQLVHDYCSFIEKQYPESCSSISIGCVIGKKKCKFDELCQIADTLMYEVKKNGKRGCKIIELE